MQKKINKIYNKKGGNNTEACPWSLKKLYILHSNSKKNATMKRTALHVPHSYGAFLRPGRNGGTGGRYSQAAQPEAVAHNGSHQLPCEDSNGTRNLWLGQFHLEILQVRAEGRRACTQQKARPTKAARAALLIYILCTGDGRLLVIAREGGKCKKSIPVATSHTHIVLSMAEWWLINSFWMHMHTKLKAITAGLNHQRMTETNSWQGILVKWTTNKLRHENQAIHKIVPSWNGFAAVQSWGVFKAKKKWWNVAL